MKTKNLLKKAFLLLALIGGASSAWADDVTLFSTDFSSSDWSSYTSSSHITAQTTVNGIYFNCADYVANGRLYYNGGGNMSSSRYCAIHVTGVNGSIKVVVEKNEAKRCFKYVFAEATTISGPGSENTQAEAETTTTLDYELTGSGSDVVFYFYQQGSSQPNGIKSITITTPASSGKTALTGSWSDSAPFFAVGSSASIPTFSVTGGGTLGTDYTVAYTKTDASGIVTLTDGTGAISAISTETTATATVTATVTIVNTEDYEMATTSYDCAISVIDPIQYSTPTITEKNGTVQITSGDNVLVSQIKYSLDNGDSWNTYSIPFNLATTTTVKAKVVTGTDPNYIDSDIASEECDAIPSAAAGSLSITLYKNNDWTESASQDGSSTKDTWTGNTSTDFDGYVIALDNEGQTGSNIKALSTGNAINSKTTIKGSNGRKLTFTIPAGIKVNRMTIYSYTNGDNNNKYSSGWTINDSAADMIGLSLQNNDANDGKSESSASNPDVRVFSFDTPLEGSFTLNNSGYQQCFYMVLDYTPTSVSKTITSAGWATYCSPYALDLANATGLTDAYIITGATGSVLSTTSVKDGTIPANTGILIEAPVGTVTIPVVASSSTDVSKNKLVGVTTETPGVAAGIYVLMGTPKVGFYETTNAFTVGANTAYLPANFDEVTSGARSAYFFGGDITGVNQVEAAAEAKAQDGKFIENGKLVIVKNGQKFNAAGALIY